MRSAERRGKGKRTNEPNGRPAVDPVVRGASRAGEGLGAAPGSVKRSSNEETAKTPVVTRAEEERRISERRRRRGRAQAHFLKTLKKGMVAEEKRWTLLMG